MFGHTDAYLLGGWFLLFWCRSWEVENIVKGKMEGTREDIGMWKPAGEGKNCIKYFCCVRIDGCEVNIRTMCYCATLVTGRYTCSLLCYK